MSGRALPLRARPFDLVIVAFFIINLLFITYVVDFEQLIIADPYYFMYPLWPPAPARAHQRHVRKTRSQPAPLLR